MRHTFGTHLSKGGVSPRTAQAAMRASDLINRLLGKRTESQYDTGQADDRSADLLSSAFFQVTSFPRNRRLCVFLVTSMRKIRFP